MDDDIEIIYEGPVVAATATPDPPQPAIVAEPHTPYTPTIHIAKSICNPFLDIFMKMIKVEFEATDSLVPDGTIQFRHKMPRHAGYGASDMDDTILVVFPFEKHLKLFEEEISALNGQQPKSETMAEWVQKLKAEHPRYKKFVLLVRGVEAYLRSFPDDPLDTDTPVSILGTTDPDMKDLKFIIRAQIDYVLWMIGIGTEVNYRYFETSHTLAQYVKEYANSAGKAFMEECEGISGPADNTLYAVPKVPNAMETGCERSDWIHQPISYDKMYNCVKGAIALKYKTNDALMKAYADCSSTSERKDLFYKFEVELNGKKYRISRATSILIWRAFANY